MIANSLRWRLREGWQVRDRGGALIISSGSRSFVVRGLGAHSEAAAAALRGHFEHLTTVLPDPLGDDLFAELERRGLLVPVAPSDAEWAESRLASYFEYKGVDPVVARRQLAGARVLIIGVGGTGSVVLQHLVGAGLRRFVLVDCDTVRTFDLERQFLFGLDDVNRSKVASAGNYVLERNPDAEVRPIEARIVEHADVLDILASCDPVDAAVICIDHPPATAFTTVATALWEAGVPFVHGGVMLEGGFHGPFFYAARGSPPPSSLPLFNPEIDCEPEPTKCCFPPFNTIVAAHLAGDLLHFLVGLHDSLCFEARTFLDFQDVRAQVAHPTDAGADPFLPS